MCRRETSFRPAFERLPEGAEYQPDVELARRTRTSSFQGAVRPGVEEHVSALARITAEDLDELCPDAIPACDGESATASSAAATCPDARRKPQRSSSGPRSGSGSASGSGEGDALGEPGSGAGGLAQTVWVKHAGPGDGALSKRRSRRRCDRPDRDFDWVALMVTAQPSRPDAVARA